jgi:hypothetical protein
MGVASMEEEFRELNAAVDNLKMTIIKEVQKNWPQLIVIYLVICGLALLVNWFVTGNIFS